MAFPDGEVVRLQRSQVRHAAELMARAFQADPLFEYILPDDRTRLQSSSALHRPSLHYGLLYGEVHTTPRVDGVAVWLVPQHPVMTLRGMLRAGIAVTRLRLGKRAFSRLTRYLECSARAAGECVPGPHWHLLLLAVDPSCQGRGIGGALVEPVLARADADGLPCYLDTFNERAVPFYERRGFSVVAQVRVPDGGPRFWIMLRQPAATGDGSD